ncbi:MAG: DUF3105 domain-containing protein [Jatrophihabitans sp.]|uniref:DUF3105 domain-containing protein n=1 Tax=Jatrophihabitans sp. TaxID=1932789 RepID=UPI003F7FB587
MAQRKNPPAKAGSRPGSRSGATATSGKVSTAKPGGAGRPPARKPGKSIVNQKQTPWGLIATVAVVVAFAVVVVVVAVTKSGGGSNDAGNPYTQPELPAVAKIQGVTYKKEPNHTHRTGVLSYDSTPPVGGDHSDYWADCTGTVYPQPIANENAVHMLEHGAVWVTYKQGALSQSEIATLAKDVQGNNYMAMSPYPDLKTKVSLQAWGYQLFVNSVTDPRIQQFIDELVHNPKITPEYGATCSQPTFKAHPSTFGHPLSSSDVSAANTMQDPSAAAK